MALFDQDECNHAQAIAVEPVAEAGDRTQAGVLLSHLADQVYDVTSVIESLSHSWTGLLGLVASQHAQNALEQVLIHARPLSVVMRRRYDIDIDVEVPSALTKMTMKREI